MLDISAARPLAPPAAVSVPDHYEDSAEDLGNHGRVTSEKTESADQIAALYPRFFPQPKPTVIVYDAGAGGCTTGTRAASKLRAHFQTLNANSGERTMIIYIAREVERDNLVQSTKNIAALLANCSDTVVLMTNQIFAKGLGDIRLYPHALAGSASSYLDQVNAIVSSHYERWTKKVTAKNHYLPEFPVGIAIYPEGVSADAIPNENRLPEKRDLTIAANAYSLKLDSRQRLIKTLAPYISPDGVLVGTHHEQADVSMYGKPESPNYFAESIAAELLPDAMPYDPNHRQFRAAMEEVLAPGGLRIELLAPFEYLMKSWPVNDKGTISDEHVKKTIVAAFYALQINHSDMDFSADKMQAVRNIIMAHNETGGVYRNRIYTISRPEL